MGCTVSCMVGCKTPRQALLSLLKNPFAAEARPRAGLKTQSQPDACAVAVALNQGLPEFSSQLSSQPPSLPVDAGWWQDGQALAPVG